MNYKLIKSAFSLCLILALIGYFYDSRGWSFISNILLLVLVGSLITLVANSEKSKDSKPYEKSEKSEKCEVKYIFNNQGKFEGFSFKYDDEESRIETMHDASGDMVGIHQFRYLKNDQTLKSEFSGWLSKSQVDVDSIIKTVANSEIVPDVSWHTNLHERTRSKYYNERFIDKLKRKRREGVSYSPRYNAVTGQRSN